MYSKIRILGAPNLFLLTENPYEGVKHLEMDGEYTSPMVFTEGSFENDPLERKVYDCCPAVEYESLNWKFKEDIREILTKCFISSWFLKPVWVTSLSTTSRNIFILMNYLSVCYFVFYFCELVTLNTNIKIS